MVDYLSALFQSLAPLWEMSVTAAYAAAIVIVLRLLLKKRAPRQVLCLLWLVVFARLLIPVSLESPLSIVPSALPGQEQQTVLPNPPQAKIPGTPPAPVQDSAQGQPIGGTVNPVTHDPAEPSLTVPGSVTPATLPSQPETSGFPWQAVAAGVWLAGAVAMGGYALFSYLRLRRLLFDAIRARDGAWEHPGIDSPFILGMLRPRIYLPAGLVGQPRQFILCHERAHLRRLDHIVKPLCWAALALHWFNPLVWASFVLMSRDIESACDEAVVRQLGSGVKADYSTTLLALATGRRAPSPCPLAFDEGDAKGRIKNVLSYRRPALWVIVVSVAAAVLAAVCLLTDPVAAEAPDGSPSGSPDASDAPTPTNHLADTLLDPWMKEVLDGERTFSAAAYSYEPGRSYHIDELRSFYYGDDQLLDQRVEMGRLAIVDLDRDGINEMVIFPVGDNEYLYSVVGYLILHRVGDEVYGYAPGWRSCKYIKADGTFTWSSGAADWGIGSMSFNGGELVQNDITWCSSLQGPDELYFVDGLKATREEFDAACDAHDAKAEPVWYTYDHGELDVWTDNAGMRTLDKTIPETDSGEAVLWLDDEEQLWLEWNGSTTLLDRPISSDQFENISCRDFDGDGENEVVLSYDLKGFLQLDLYEWNGGQPVLADTYDSHQLLVRFIQYNVAGYNKDTRGLTVTYSHTEGHMDDADFYRHLVSGSCTLPEGFFDGSEHIRDGYLYAYANQFHSAYFQSNTNAFYFDFDFYLADEALRDLCLPNHGPSASAFKLKDHYIDQAVGIAWFLVRYDGTKWVVQEPDQLNMYFQGGTGQVSAAIDDIDAAAPLDAPVVNLQTSVPKNPDEWYKVAELPDDMIWVYSRNFGTQTLIRWGGDFGTSYRVFDQIAYDLSRENPPDLIKLDDFDGIHGPLAVIYHLDDAKDQLVVYDLDKADPVVYTHDWKPLADDFKANYSFRNDNGRLTLTYQCQGQMIEYPSDTDFQNGETLRVEGSEYFFFDTENSGDIEIWLRVGCFTGDNQTLIGFLYPISWTLRFNGTGFDVVPGSCHFHIFHNE